jgi:hypothetical protein
MATIRGWQRTNFLYLAPLSIKWEGVSEIQLIFSPPAVGGFAYKIQIPNLVQPNPGQFCSQN